MEEMEGTTSHKHFVGVAEILNIFEGSKMVFFLPVSVVSVTMSHVACALGDFS